MVERLVHHAEVIVLRGDSYRGRRPFGYLSLGREQWIRAVEKRRAGLGG